MSRRMEDAEKLAKPAALTVSVYSPTGRLEKWNAPSPEDFAVRVSPVPGFVTLISALATKAADGSEMRPSSVPVGSCAFAMTHKDANSKRILIGVLSVMKIYGCSVMLDRSALTGNNRNQLVAVVNWKRTEATARTQRDSLTGFFPSVH